MRPGDSQEAVRAEWGRALRNLACLLVGVGVLIGTSGGVLASVDSPTVAAQTTGPEAATVCGEPAGPLVERYNSAIADVPWFLKLAVANREIHGVVHNDTVGNYSIVTGPNGTVQTFSGTTPASPSVRILTQCDAFLAVLSAEEPVETFRSEHSQGRVRIVGLDLGSWLLIEAITHPLLAAGGSLLLILLIAAGVYYYVRRRQMMRDAYGPVEGESE